MSGNFVVAAHPVDGPEVSKMGGFIRDACTRRFTGSQEAGMNEGRGEIGIVAPVHCQFTKPVDHPLGDVLPEGVLVPLVPQRHRQQHPAAGIRIGELPRLGHLGIVCPGDRMVV